RAEEREQIAIDAVKKFGDVIKNEPELKNNPSLESLRKKLLSEPMGFFKTLRDQLQADKDTQPEASSRLAAATFELANLTYDLGDRRDALQLQRQSVAIRERLARDNPGIIAFQNDLAQSHHTVGFELSEMGQPVEALVSYK